MSRERILWWKTSRVQFHNWNMTIGNFFIFVFWLSQWVDLRAYVKRNFFSYFNVYYLHLKYWELPPRTIRIKNVFLNIFLNYIKPYVRFVGSDSLFMQDKVCPHVVQKPLRFMKEVEIAWFEWPICSPDLNPIEHIWDRLGRGISSHTRPQ